MAFGDVRLGDLTFPRDHEAGTEVPQGGSMCKNCKFLKDAERRICGEPNFIKWEGKNKPAGSPIIPLPIDRYCSDWYKMRTGKWQAAAG